MADTTKTVIGPVSAFALAKAAGYAGDSEQWAREQAVAATVLAQIIAGVHTDNRLMNADFTQWVAQAGVCATHAGSSVKFAGDRWELQSGTLTAVENENGNGYSAVTLNGVIRQRAETPPENPRCGVFVLSGEASAEYADGIVTITGTNAVLESAYLYDYDGDMSMPVRPVKRGYAAELLDCMRHFIRIGPLGEFSWSGYVHAVSGDQTTIRACFEIPAPMRLEYPTMGLYYRTNIKIMPGSITPSTIGSARTTGTMMAIILYAPLEEALTADMPVVIKPNCTVELSADLLC